MRARDLTNRLGINLGRNTTANPSRKSSEPVQLVTNTGAGGAYTSLTASFECRTPSTRLAGCIFLGNDQGVALPQTGLTWTVALQAWGQTKDGLWVPGNIVETGVLLPSFYEFATMAPSIKGTVTVPNGPGTGVGATNLWAWAEWEPGPGDNIDPAELAQLFGACSFQATSATLNTSNTGV